MTKDRLEVVGCAALFTASLGAWVAGTRRIGWLISAFSSILWLFYAVKLETQAAFVATVIGLVISIRNFVVWKHREQDAIVP